MKETLVFFAEIIEVEEESVLMNCQINENPVVNEVRHFAPELFENPKLNDYFKVTIITQVGSLTMSLEKVNEDLSKMFEKPDYFSSLKDTAFFNPE
jgi:hypothetical protein